MDYFRPPGADRTRLFERYRQRLIEEQRPIRPIRKIIVKDGVNVLCQRGEEAKLMVSGETPAAITSVETAYYDEILVIQRRGAFGSAGHAKAVVAIALPEVPPVNVKGRSDFTLLDLSQSDLDIQVSGSGYVAASGQVDRLGAWVFGSGDVNVRELLVDDAVLSVSGSGYIDANVRAKVSARILGTGDIVIRGNPRYRDRHVTGFGRIDFL